MTKANLILVGFMGTGKSATGRRLAARLHREFVDMDAAIEAREGRAISDIFTQDGEPAFRRLERALVRELSAREDLVIAAGGGVVLDPENIRDFERTGVVVCLTAQPEELLRRLSGARHRPLLEQGDKEQRLRLLLEQRRPLYDAIAHQVDTTRLAPDEVARRVLEIFSTSS